MRILEHKRLFLVLFALSLGLAACAGGSGGSGSSGPRRSSTRITAEELGNVAELDLFSAIQRLRPAWLRAGTRGALPQVIVDGTPQQGGVEALRAFRATDATGLELMSASDATTRYGTGYTAGAIVVTTRR